MLTNAVVKAATARSRAYKLADERGMHLFVTPAGCRSYRLKYRRDGREQLLVLGRHPEISLTEARARRDAAREQLRRGEDPSPAARRRAEEEAARAAALESSFETIAREWHQHRAPRWSAEHAGDVLGSLALHVFPSIGAKRLADIGPTEVLELLQAVELAGAAETAKRIRQRISAVFCFAIARGRHDKDPAAALTRELTGNDLVEHHPALTDIEDVRALYAAIGAADAAELVTIAGQLLALTAVRQAALRGASWEEFSGIDWNSDADAPAALWTIPPARMKLAKAKKRDAGHAHLVPLSDQAVQLLRRARRLSEGYGKFRTNSLVFPGRIHDKPIGAGAIGAVIAATDFAGRHVPHGWRASFSTILNGFHREDRAAIDLCLAHTPKNDDGKTDKVEAAYNRAQHLDRRRLIFQRWADLLTEN